MRRHKKFEQCNLRFQYSEQCCKPTRHAVGLLLKRDICKEFKWCLSSSKNEEVDSIHFKECTKELFHSVQHLSQHTTSRRRNNVLFLCECLSNCLCCSHCVGCKRSVVDGWLGNIQTPDRWRCCPPTLWSFHKATSTCGDVTTTCHLEAREKGLNN